MKLRIADTLNRADQRAISTLFYYRWAVLEDTPLYSLYNSYDDRVRDARIQLNCVNNPPSANNQWNWVHSP